MTAKLQGSTCCVGRHRDSDVARMAVIGDHCSDVQRSLLRVQHRIHAAETQDTQLDQGQAGRAAHASERATAELSGWWGLPAFLAFLHR